MMPPFRSLPAVLFLLLPACTTLHTVKVAVSPEIANTPVRVDIRPATPALRQVSAREYWRPGSSARAGDVQTLTFGVNQPYQQEVTAHDWHAKQLLVITDIRGFGGDAYTRLEVPARSWWSVPEEAEVKVSLAGLRADPPIWPSLVH